MSDNKKVIAELQTALKTAKVLSDKQAASLEGELLEAKKKDNKVELLKAQKNARAASLRAAVLEEMIKLATKLT